MRYGDANKDENTLLRLAKVLSLRRQGGPGAFEGIEPLLYDPEPEVRIAAVEALAEVGGSRSVEPLSELLDDIDSRVRSTVVTTLGEVGDLRVLPLLEAIRRMDKGHSARLTTNYRSVSQDAQEAIQRIQQGIRDKRLAGQRPLQTGPLSKQAELVARIARRARITREEASMTAGEILDKYLPPDWRNRLIKVIENQLDQFDH